MSTPIWLTRSWFLRKNSINSDFKAWYMDCPPSPRKKRASRGPHQPRRNINPVLFQNPHRRYNAVSSDWVLVSPRRVQRPSQGWQEPMPPAAFADCASECYLWPRNRRANGKHNPACTGESAGPYWERCGALVRGTLGSRMGPSS